MLDPTAQAELLRQRSAQARRQQASLTAAIEDTREARRLTFADDEHDPEGSTASLDQARDEALLARAVATLTEVDAALTRLAAGSYGICARCGQQIPELRLVARPEARHCLPCSERLSRRGR